jgi:hypothetical protein
VILVSFLLALLQPQALPGFYTTSQIEVGAALELDEDGKFQYQLDYGAVSEAAEGQWSSDGKAVYLTATKMVGAYKTANFNREPLVIDGGNLLLRRYDTVIRFEREELPTPTAKDLKE